MPVYNVTLSGRIVIYLNNCFVKYSSLTLFLPPNRTSLARILDLGMASAMAILSLIVSSVLTDGFYKTCGSFDSGRYVLP